MPLIFHERDQDEQAEPASKRPKLDGPAPAQDIFPPSHVLLGVPLPELTNGFLNFSERNVGISEYVGHGIPKIEGIIKQRFTDFLVYEIDLDGNVVHLTDVQKPPTPKGEEEAAGTSADAQPAAALTEAAVEEATKEPEPTEPEGPWPDRFNTRLSEFLSAEAIEKLKGMFLEGPVPPLVSDSGWGSRPGASSSSETTTTTEPVVVETRGRGRGRGGRGGRGGGRGGRANGREDHRKVVSEPIQSKATRTDLHKAVRELFGGKLESEADMSSPASEEGTRIVIKWNPSRGRGGGGGGGNRGGRGRAPRGTFPPYIHFTLQKTNRDTQDALAHLSRVLKVSLKDLSVAGTKDKRGITVQRVSLKRNNKTVEDVWRAANGQVGRQSHNNGTVNKRGDRGVRIGDFNYRKASLELGMLKGNEFLITLRSVQVDSMETLDKALGVIKEKGFINYYGMQRFGTASVPTHSIGLALLKSEWQAAVDMILQKRPGEHPDVEVARNAWLVEHDLDKALQLMPRRVVAERCILESYKKQKGDTRNAMGSLSTIPKNLRLMYVHAYQSYVWNAIVSERIRTFGVEKPVVGDLVFDNDPQDVAMPDVEQTEEPAADENENEGEEAEPPEADEAPLSNRAQKRARPPRPPQRVKTLTEEDVDKYTIFDVLMPLPGTDVAYPGGALGEKYREYLRMDGLDPDNFVRKQREYTLSGSYRAMLHLPKELSWTVLRYTDPDVALAQADEDKLLNFDPPMVSNDGLFMALQIKLSLGTAAYATMALREITKTETSSHFQSSLTSAAEDQKFRGTGTDVDATGEPEE
ncbi:TRUD domain-containing protein [Mycena indigotica]|uniref:TRUD domain-containing protein n=1 Tax=Mycena indigotica TaxID=2126181 RepID=A0A8H6SMY9_9AGAR|nr:TRUD domain-containing protein [Mycena indigotica]KAF7301777.1 TRUD domain-containing protein [Mycena indigotica]